jgi:hypothetical protein
MTLALYGSDYLITIIRSLLSLAMSHGHYRVWRARLVYKTHFRRLDDERYACQLRCEGVVGLPVFVPDTCAYDGYQEQNRKKSSREVAPMNLPRGAAASRCQILEESLDLGISKLDIDEWLASNDVRCPLIKKAKGLLVYIKSRVTFSNQFIVHFAYFVFFLLVHHH